MDIEIIFKIALIGIATALINLILRKLDKDEIAQIVTLVGVVVCILLVLDMIAGLFDNIRSIFRLY
ncbi:MAG: stage III sporulation protein AC [Christensenellales bacterium]|jgi:stage III sporulation protein AC